VFPVVVNNRIAIPTGTYVEGQIDALTKPRVFSPHAQLQIDFDKLIYSNGYAVEFPTLPEGAAPAEDVIPAEGHGVRCGQQRKRAAARQRLANPDGAATSAGARCGARSGRTDRVEQIESRATAIVVLRADSRNARDAGCGDPRNAGQPRDSADRDSRRPGDAAHRDTGHAANARNSRYCHSGLARKSKRCLSRGPRRCATLERAELQGMVSTECCGGRRRHATSCWAVRNNLDRIGRAPRARRSGGVELAWWRRRASYCCGTKRPPTTRGRARMRTARFLWIRFDSQGKASPFTSIERRGPRG
jgi:hypothetical protein